ncbi:MAG: hypothetical protein CMA60_05685 [Euryarchaeota archaeon]|nr:hypothetical protein [Euryarchaeota archaeon]|tara:strand:+ start:20777 stop:21205 length:429 start_codon:yes stop_codon:yes gene_type:complete
MSNEYYDVEGGQIAPIPKELFELCEKECISEVIISWSGGNDEGYVEVTAWKVGEEKGSWYMAEQERNDVEKAAIRVIENKFEVWADEHSYSGAGEGSPYGHDLTIDILNKKMSAEQWWMERVDDCHFVKREIEIRGEGEDKQ